MLSAALPAAVDEFLLQPDLTAVVPGPPTPSCSASSALAADLESTGGASVYRISPASLRRALDAGRTGADLQRFFAEHSRTPVPQALEYLINDVATQHGRLRAGAATSYLRCDDVALLDRVLTDPALDVARPAADRADRGDLRPPASPRCWSGCAQHGFAPAAETADGAVRQPGRRRGPGAGPASTRGSRRVRASAVADSQLAEVVNRLRAGERLAARGQQRRPTGSRQQIPGVTSASILELLRTAVRGRADHRHRLRRRHRHPVPAHPACRSRSAAAWCAATTRRTPGCAATRCSGSPRSACSTPTEPPTSG